MLLGRIRIARAYVAKTFGSDYRFVEYRFKTEGLHLLMDYFSVEDSANSTGIIVADAYGRLARGNLPGNRFAEFDYERTWR